MSKIHQRTQPLSCSRHKRNGCRAQAQAALPTMMSGLDGCLRADVTWVGSGQKEGESFHVCLSAAQCWRGTVAEQGSAWSASRLYMFHAIWKPRAVCRLHGGRAVCRLHAMQSADCARAVSMGACTCVLWRDSFKENRENCHDFIVLYCVRNWEGISVVENLVRHNNRSFRANKLVIV